MFLGIIFFLELTAGVLAFVFKDWIKDQLYFFINNNIRAYRDDIDLQNLIDFTQEYVSLNVAYFQVESLLGRMNPMNVPPGFCVCQLQPTSDSSARVFSFVRLFSNLLYNLHDLYSNGKCLIFHLSQFLLRTKKKTLRQRGYHQGCSLLSTFEDSCFAIGLPSFLAEGRLNVDFFYSWSPFWSFSMLHIS